MTDCTDRGGRGVMTSLLNVQYNPKKNYESCVVCSREPETHTNKVI